MHCRKNPVSAVLDTRPLRCKLSVKNTPMLGMLICLASEFGDDTAGGEESIDAVHESVSYTVGF